MHKPPNPFTGPKTPCPHTQDRPWLLLDSPVQHPHRFVWQNLATIETPRRCLTKCFKEICSPGHQFLQPHNQANLSHQTLFFFTKMSALDGLRPVNFIFAGLVKACAGLSCVKLGQQVHAQFVLFLDCFDIRIFAECKKSKAVEMFKRLKEENLYAWTALISRLVQRVGILDPFILSSIPVAAANLAALELGKQQCTSGYVSKCSDVSAAKKILFSMWKRDVVSWTSIIMGIAQHGQAREALSIYDDMILADHVGLLDKGRDIFKSLINKYGLNPSLQHYTCLFDLYARLGNLDEAEDLFNTMPFKPDEAAWASLLSACKQHGNTKMGIRIADNLLSLGPKEPSTCILLL
ncbi:hypothetical protein M9H77_22993 [Catharanthus roseus]|uniref:Uncharacterized protein n=1 Tax=Catharanthus roseus TaxID=4058 RepID=A0ACC0AS05_CATRO|nr:hypothetical protein M9H77_22993 [Catharanthus roseus]